MCEFCKVDKKHSIMICMRGTLVFDKIIIIKSFWPYVFSCKAMFLSKRSENALRAL